MERLSHRTRATYEPGFHVQMLLDERRVSHFADAIRATVTPGDVVVDAGAGTGLLSLLAAECGASRVLALELDSEMTVHARRNISASQYADVIEVVETDATQFEPDLRVDVLLGEMLHGWLVEEAQVPAFQHLRRWLRPAGKLLPYLVQNKVALAELPVLQPGFALFSPFHRWETEEPHRSLSETVVAETIDLRTARTGRRSGRVELEPHVSGVANVLALDSCALLADGIWIGETHTLFPTIYIPIPPLEVQATDRLSVEYSYFVGGRWDRMEFSVGQETAA